MQATFFIKEKELMDLFLYYQWLGVEVLPLLRVPGISKPVVGRRWIGVNPIEPVGKREVFGH